MIADCLPVLFCSQAGDEVAAAHAGWCRLYNGMLEQTVAAFSAQPSKISVWLVLAIGSKQFVVGSEVRAVFIEEDKDALSAFVPHGEKFLADIYLLARQRLLRAGIQTIYGGDRCTFREMSYFPYRRDRTMGRLASLIWLI